jgi:uncharacterized protein (DUF736 family)
MRFVDSNHRLTISWVQHSSVSLLRKTKILPDSQPDEQRCPTLQIGYASILVIMLTVGAAWLKRTGVSQEYLDSWVIMVWVSLIRGGGAPEKIEREVLIWNGDDQGIVNTFTEHHDAWNENWSHKGG